MPTFKLTIDRVDTYQAEVEVEAATLEQAVADTNKLLDAAGWAAVCGDGDGEYCDSYSCVHVPKSEGEPVVTLGDLRALIADAPAALPIYPEWANGPPGDSEPAVSIYGAKLTALGLEVLVGLSYLNEEEADEDDEAGDDVCDICMRSGVASYRTTFAGSTVCGSDACQAEADRLDDEYNREHPDQA